jgi:hypothetical protein
MFGGESLKALDQARHWFFARRVHGLAEFAGAGAAAPGFPCWVEGCSG